MTTQQDSVDVERLRELSDAARPGPWKVFNLLHGAYEVCKADDYARGGVCVPHREEDAAFIVAAVNHVRAALSLPITQRDELLSFPNVQNVSGERLHDAIRRLSIEQGDQNRGEG